MKRKTLRLLTAILLLAVSSMTCSTLQASDNHLVVGVHQDPLNWDPIDTYRMAWSAIATSVFEGLVERDLDAKIKPGLAKSWKIDLPKKRIRFYLQQGVKFHNGHPFKADSVKYTFDRLLAKESKSPQKGNYAAIREVRIIDDYTVDFLLKEIDAVLIVKLSSYAGVIVPKTYIEEKGEEYFDLHPVGTGPYKMINYVPDQKVELERYDNYWKKKVRPEIKKITFRIIPEASTRLAELQTGNIDINNKVEINQARVLNKDKRVNLVKSDSPTVYALRFDVLRKPTDNVKVREAIALAIDMDTIIETVLEGNARRINSFQSQLSFGYDSSLPVRPYNPKRAKQLLREANYDFNQTLLLTTAANDATYKEVAQAIQLYLKQAGIKTRLETAEFNVFINEMVPNRKAGHMFRAGWGGWTLDFDNTAFSMYKHGQRWCPDFKDARVEELIDAERVTMDPAKRKAIFSKLSQRLYETVPDVPLFQRMELWGVSKKVKGFQAPVDGRMRFENVSLSK